MPGWLKGLLTVSIWTVVPPGGAALALNIAGALPGHEWVVIAAGIFGLLYGLQSGILTSYDLGRPLGWLALLLDLTWSLPNTLWGFVVGNLIFWFVGTPSRAQSADQGWVVFKPRSASGFGNSVLQTHGTTNLGGAGQHERMHLLQARSFGPLFLPLYLISYVATVTIQVLWTATLGWILALAKVRPKAPLQPPPASVVGGFFGWIYYATIFELWAYASGNP